DRGPARSGPLVNDHGLEQGGAVADLVGGVAGMVPRGVPGGLHRVTARSQATGLPGGGVGPAAGVGIAHAAVVARRPTQPPGSRLTVPHATVVDDHRPRRRWGRRWWRWRRDGVADELDANGDV